MSTTTTTARQASFIERDFDSFSVFYDSVDLGDPANVGTKCVANILCFNNRQQVGILRFHDRQPPPVNTYRGSQPNYVVLINYHISRFNDILSILRLQKQLTLSFDIISLAGGVVTTYQPIGQ